MSIAELDVSSYSGPSDGPDDRVPPQDVHAEQSVLGGMLLSKDAIADVVEVLRGNDFYRPAHELIYDAILDLYGRGEPADADHRLRRADQARRARPGRRPGLPAQADRLGPHRRQRRLLRARSSAERAVLRRLVEAGTRIVQMGYGQGGGDVDDIVNAAQAEIYAGRRKRGGEDYHVLGDVIEATVDEIEARLGVAAATWSACPPASPTSTRSPTACTRAR